MYADCDTPQSFKAPPPAALLKEKEDQLNSTYRQKKKARPIEHTRIWVLNGGTNTPTNKIDIKPEQTA